ncbi:2',3'-cyclic-nucleotide 2'-phosphodiesterase [Candidatus Mycoplasma haematobovis]|uniref:2',3'-cyclic-nucleotide 2'-phosphodiesterase n=1 Tax=Candidatus Mycoplasma haematobovis TaxID=432608 RepID=A0A1A9QDB1_9MOLU|nr:HD domain-containing protein [Candidatus Mycoplasma haematobovis]OAL10228.1 2',3'-cyclic-nucleotide 2'-phosphodiesterase [Candidatus Mycoplasma haematobovis]
MDYNEKNFENDPEVKKELEAYEKYIQENKKNIFNRIVLDAIYTLRIKQPIINCCKKIDLASFPNFTPETIGQLLGKEGQHKQFFINLTKVDLEIDKDKKNRSGIVISKYNSIDVEKACELIKKLLAVKRWDLKKMESLYEEVNREFRERCKKIGEEWLKNFLQYEEFSEQLAVNVGTLQFVYSYSQNILEHSIEVSQISANIAAQLELDVLKAKRAGFFHDIGKATANFGDHVEEGLKIAQEEGLEEYIQNSIESHHGRVVADNPYSMIVKAADILSAGREGARPRQIELIEQRKDMIHKHLMTIPWAKKVVIKNVGNLVQIFIKPEKFSFDKLPIMRLETRAKLRQLQSEYSYNYQIEFHVIYEEHFLLENK